MSEFVGRSFMTDKQRDEILKLLPEEGNVLELGTGHGVTVAYWAMHRPEVQFLSVDMFKAAQGTGPGVIEDWLANRRPNQHLFVGTSDDALRYIYCGCGHVWCIMFDAIFIDGSHSCSDCLRDLRVLEQVSAKTGRILVHDYGRTKLPDLAGVTMAVDEFCLRHKWAVKEVVGCVAVLERVNG